MPETSSPVLEEFRRFLRHALPPPRHVWDRGSGFPERVEWQRRLASGGWAGLSWPVEHGGRGLTIRQRLACESELVVRGCPPPAGILGLNNVAPALIAYGSPAQQSHLPHILRADEIWCQGFSEPEAGSDLAGLRTVAETSSHGFVVTGRKIWTSDGMEATHCMLLARTDTSQPRHRGISVLLLPMDTPGVERKPIRQIDGGTGFAEVTFDGVELPPDALLGPLNDGWRITMTTLAAERAAVIAQVAGLEQDVQMEIRRCRGTSDEVLRDQLMERYVEGRVLGSLGEHMLSRLVPGEPPGPEHALIRLAQGNLRQRLAETRADFAGRDLLDERGAHQRAELLASRSVSIAAGTREVLKTVIAQRVLGLPNE